MIDNSCECGSAYQEVDYRQPATDLSRGYLNNSKINWKQTAAIDFREVLMRFKSLGGVQQGQVKNGRMADAGSAA